MTTKLKKRPGHFQLPAFSNNRNKAEANGRMSYTLLSMASDERIKEATPSLKALYAFLERKP